ncbi:hypothetical protein C8Q77DRAFT_570172 [Trametes polyzona]|nr:hypothetical protein C8Q77DRAFT_570172 [Trametes polyzona]
MHIECECETGDTGDRDSAAAIVQASSGDTAGGSTYAVQVQGQDTHSCGGRGRGQGNDGEAERGRSREPVFHSRWTARGDRGEGEYITGQCGRVGWSGAEKPEPEPEPKPKTCGRRSRRMRTHKRTRDNPPPANLSTIRHRQYTCTRWKSGSCAPTKGSTPADHSSRGYIVTAASASGRAPAADDGWRSLALARCPRPSSDTRSARACDGEGVRSSEP